MNQSHRELTYEIAAAGLLHDIGKVLQPAGVKLSSDAKLLEQMICPVFDGSYSHRHVLFTAHAMFQSESNFGRMDRSRIERIANYHHRPSTGRLEENILTKADWLASGHDRRPSPQEEERTGLSPIVARLSLTGKSNAVQNDIQSQVPTGALSFSQKECLPGAQQSIDIYKVQCREITNSLLKALNQSYANEEECLESLLGITQRLLHAIPASRHRGHIPDVSLYDHSRMVAALGACLAMLDHGDGTEANQVKSRFRFISLGMGGIQDFIFHSNYPLEPGDVAQPQTENKGSAKRLRARSFYISLFSWVAARKVLKEIGLPPTNLVYDAGGHALLLVPDTPEVLITIENTLRNIALEIREKLGGTLRFDYAISRRIQDHDFHVSQFSQVFQDIEHERANARYRFPDQRLLPADDWMSENWVLEDQESLPIDREKFLNQLRKLGQQLPKVRYLAIESGERHSGEWEEEIFGMRVSLHLKRPSAGLIFALQLDPAEFTTPLFLSGSHLPLMSSEDQARLEALLGGDDDEEPLEIGEPLPFHALAQLSTAADGTAVSHPMLGIFKADVDSLGALFSYGFQNTAEVKTESQAESDNGASLGRMAALSRTLDQFFKGFLTEKLRCEYCRIYTVFVGGDDLFLIGPWYDIVRLSQDLQDWFSQLTCQNPDVTFSAGLVFSKPTTPVRHLAELAEESLDAAKSAGRNRISYGNVTLTWDQYQRALKLHQLMVDCQREHTEQKRMNASLVYRLLQYSQQALKLLPWRDGLQGAPKPSFAEMKWRAQMSYDLKRNLPEPTPDRPLIQQLHAALIQIQADEASILYTAASLTLYFCRGESQ